MKNRDIIVIASQAWDIEIGSNCKNIALELAKENRVLYVNPPLDRISSLKKKNDVAVSKRLDIIKNKKKALEDIGNFMWTLYPPFIAESINWMQKGFMYSYLNRRNNSKLANSILESCKTLDFKNCIVFNDSFMFGGLFMKEMLKPACHVYYIRDNLISQPYFKKHGEYIEPMIIAKSDVVVANSVYLKDYAKKYNANSFYVGQGCEFEDFVNIGTKEIPTEFSSISGPKIGYIGFLTALRLDIALIGQIALEKPEWNIVLVGPEDEVFQKSILHQIPNVIFFGAVPTSKVSNYIKGFDVCINPQEVNDLTIGNYPRKVDEYLAAGKPVVATRTITMEIFEPYVYLGSNKEEYIKLIQKSLDENSQELINERKKFVSAHTWENSVAEIVKAMSEI